MKFSILPILVAPILIFCFLNCENPSQNEEPSLGQKTEISNQTKNSPTSQSKETSPFKERVETYEKPDRLFWQKPELVIEKMGDLSDKTVADIGAASGYFSRRLAQKAKKVIAIDIDPDFIAFMDSIKLVELSVEYQKRFETRLAEPDDSKLKNGEVDIILIVNTYVYIRNRVDYLTHLFYKLKPNGKIVIVDFKKKRIAYRNAPAAPYRVPLYMVENELSEAGFIDISSDDRSLDFQYIVMAQIPGEEKF